MSEINSYIVNKHKARRKEIEKNFSCLDNLFKIKKSITGWGYCSTNELDIKKAIEKLEKAIILIKDIKNLLNL